MSSHREAPEISKDPVADSTDLYAFVSPDKPDTVTLIANYIPLQLPSGGPNFFEFGDDVLYTIHINNSGDGSTNITYEFRFTTEVADPGTFLYNVGPISSLTSANWNRKQFYSVTRIDHTGAHVLGSHLPCPPCNVGVNSTPNIVALDAEATHVLHSGETVFCGQRADPFYVDLGSIFDLGDLRPFQSAFLIPGSAEPGINALAGMNVHTIALQVPITRVTSNGSHPSTYTDKHATVGIWTTASRQKSSIIGSGAHGPWVQISRLGNPLINEVIIPMGEKDNWNTQKPSADAQYAKYYANPGLAGLLPVLYPDAFPKLKALNAAGTARADLEAILLTGIPSGVITGFQNFTGTVKADMLRLNTGFAPATKPSILGVVGGDVAGFPNGRRVYDDVTSIELKAVAGALYSLIDSKYKPDAAAGLLYDVVDPSKTSPSALSKIGVSYTSHFPYLAPGNSGSLHPDPTGVLTTV